MIGIYGGTFNPVHYGHLRTALEVKEFFKLDELRLLPCYLPAHRQQPEVSAEQRLAMLRLAISHSPELQIDTRELQRFGTSYMVDTLASIRAEQNDKSILLIIGSDAFAGLTSWHQWQKLFDYAHIVVMRRPGADYPVLPEFFSPLLICDPTDLSRHTAGCLYFHTVTLLDISASQIRELLARGSNPQFLLPDNVLAYIYQHQLYRSHILD